MDTRNALVLLLLSPVNPLWKQVWSHVPEDELESRIDAAEVKAPKERGDARQRRQSPETIGDVRAGRDHSTMHATHFDRLIETIESVIDVSEFPEKALAIERLHNFALCYKSMPPRRVKRDTTFENLKAPDHYLVDGAKALGISPGGFRQILEPDLRKNKPLLANVFYPKERVGPAFKELEGLYDITMERKDGVYHCKLWAQYILPRENSFAIRCWLRVPSNGIMLSRDESWNYDGFVVMRNGVGFWLFDKCEAGREDMIIFCTGAYRLVEPEDARKMDYTDRLDPLMGLYLTSTQELIQQPVSQKVVIQRHEKSDYFLKDEGQIKDFMNSFWYDEHKAAPEEQELPF